jgi:eukaryotic-like serine/threonine-protein kinase
VLSAGYLLGNRYRLDERIATGGMGDVWRGTDVVLGRVVAVKVLKAAMLSDPEFAARFYGEARMMASFRHPGVVEVYDYASADQTDGERVAYLVMAYVEGEPLSNRVREGPLSVVETMSIVAQAADALHAAHQVGVVHRDVKPGNLIVKPSGAVILVDFGVARSTAVTSVTQVNAIVGTALYMAPEQVAKGRVSAATDIYALGAVAYHCIAGVPPFDGDNALQVAMRHLDDQPEPLPSHVPPPVRELIARAMAKQPADRFETAAEFAEAAFAAAGPLDWKRMTGTLMVAPFSPPAPTRAVPAPRHHPEAPPVPARKPRRKETALIVAVCAALLIAVGIGGVLLLNNGDDAGKRGEQGMIVPSAPASDEASTEPLPLPVATPKSSTRPGGPNRGRSSPATAPPTSTTARPPSVKPTANPTPTQPTKAPTTAPTTPPPTTPATTPTTTPPAGGAGGDS